jgi:DNA polymerase delta subunit 1
MKKDQLIDECKKLGLDTTGKVAELRERLKAATRSESVEDIFKKYERDTNK